MSVRTRQPQGAQRLAPEWSRGSSLLFSFGGGNRLALGTNSNGLVVPSTRELIACSDGIAYKGNVSAGTGGDSITISNAFPSSNNAAFISIYVESNYSAWMSPLYSRDNGGGSTVSGDTYRYTWAGGEYTYDSGLVIPDGVLVACGHIISPNKIFSVVNGKAHSAAASHAALSWGSGSTVKIGADSFGNRAFVGNIYATGLFVDAGITEEQLLEWSRNPWSLFAPPRRIWVQLAPAAETGGATGTASVTPSPQTLTGAGAVAVTGTATITPAAQTATTAGTVGLTGTLNKMPAAQTVSATGTVLTGVTGTASITPAAQTVAASGTVPIASSAAIMPAAQTATTAGAVALLATATITPDAQTVSATGVVVSGVVGSASITQAAQTVTASSTVPIAATATLTPAAQTVTGAAAISGGTVTGTATITPTAQTVSATAAISGGTVTGTANVYVNAQTLVAQASIIVLGTATITPAPQTLLGREAGALPEEIPESSRTLASTAPRLGSEIVVVEPARLGRSPVHRNRPRLG